MQVFTKVFKYYELSICYNTANCQVIRRNDVNCIARNLCTIRAAN